MKAASAPPPTSHGVPLKHSPGAEKAALAIFRAIHGGSPEHSDDRAAMLAHAVIIQREAIAPALAEVLKALKDLRTSEQASHQNIPGMNAQRVAAREHADAILARYPISAPIAV